MNFLLIAALIFVIVLLTIYLSVYAYNQIQHPERREILKRLKTVTGERFRRDTPDITKKSFMSTIPSFNWILGHIPIAHSLERLRYQADAKESTGFFLLLTIFLALSTYIITYFVTHFFVTSLIIAVLMGSLPLVYLKRKKEKRLKKFLDQFPEALDLISRSLKAGHAFTTGMKLAADSFGDPLGTEMGRSLDEMNLGADVREALSDLALRVGCPDVKFFVVSVILQRETGGNLSEILENISNLIRQRFALQGKIRTLSAEGRLSAIILTALPFAIVFAINLMHPDLVEMLYTTPEGKMIVTVSLLMMLFGIFLIWRIVKIKV